MTRKQKRGSGYRWFAVKWFPKGWEMVWDKVMERGMLRKTVTAKRKLKRERLVRMEELTIVHVEEFGLGAVRVPVVERGAKGTSEFSSTGWRLDWEQREYAVREEVKQMVSKAFAMDWTQCIPDEQIGEWTTPGR